MGAAEEGEEGAGEVAERAVGLGQGAGVQVQTMTTTPAGTSVVVREMAVAAEREGDEEAHHRHHPDRLAPRIAYWTRTFSLVSQVSILHRSAPHLAEPR